MPEQLYGIRHHGPGSARALVQELDRQRPDMLLAWALTQLAEAAGMLGARRHAQRIYAALAPYAGRVAVAAGAVACSGATDFYLGRLAALDGDAAAAERHLRTALPLHRSLGARPMLARTLHELGAHAEALAIARECGMTRLLAQLDARPAPAERLTLRREGAVWLITYGAEVLHLPDSLGLRYLGLLTGSPGREFAATELVQLASATGGDAPARELPPVVASRGDEVLDARARHEYRKRLDELDDDIDQAEQWHDPERAARLRTERDFLVQELTAATGLAGRPRRLGSDAERARLNVTRAIRTAIARVGKGAPEAGSHLNAAIRTGMHCSYQPNHAANR